MDLNKYIGLPYEDYDCWQLIKLIYENELKTALPDYRKMYNSSSDIKQTGPVVSHGIADGHWEKVEAPEPNDVLIFDILGVPSHCGLYIDNGDFIHAFNKCNAVVENITDLSWNRRLNGVYRWKRQE